MNQHLKKMGRLKQIDFDFMIYDSRVLRVDRWKHKHPGSKAAIEAHVGKNVTKLFRS